MDEDYEQEISTEEIAARAALEPKAPAQWSWTPKNIAIAAGSIVTIGFIVWFTMEYNKSKAAAIVKAAANVAS